VVVLAVGVAALSGCGDARTPALDVTTPASPVGHTVARFASAGLLLRAVPANWRVQPGQAPLVATISSGDGTFAIWRYPRSQPLPRTHAALRQALAALIATVRARDPTFLALRNKTTRIDHQPAIVVLGLATIDGNRRETRSTHVFAYGAEVVLDAYAPAPSFVRVDRLAFLPMIRSLRLRRP
jgi:hypothetical protein